MLDKIESDEIRFYAVWVPSLPGDSEDRVPAAVRRLADDRVLHYWDAEGVLKKAYQKTMSMNGPAWDVYFVYERGIEWEDEPPVPNSYMHQLGGLPEERRLDGDKLREEILKLIDTK